jgi:hypothetical protein
MDLPHQNHYVRGRINHRSINTYHTVAITSPEKLKHYYHCSPTRLVLCFSIIKIHSVGQGRADCAALGGWAAGPWPPQDSHQKPGRRWHSGVLHLLPVFFCIQIRSGILDFLGRSNLEYFLRIRNRILTRKCISWTSVVDPDHQGSAILHLLGGPGSGSVLGMLIRFQRHGKGSKFTNISGFLPFKKAFVPS